MRAVVTPAVIEPLTFNAVRPMSMSGSTEMSSPASAIGKFMLKVQELQQMLLLRLLQLLRMN